ncbi:MAG TPA: penicillin-binding protein 2 [Candidatus Sulfotelmatobacter sp.]|nr:penicillin-binding protein 2 [Candidatus Sulfotelmatobacter sp.]
MRRHRHPPQLPLPQALDLRLARTVIVVGAVFVVLLLRLWHLQVLEGMHFFALSTNNSLRVRPVEAPRGFILDRNREILVENRPSFDVFVTPEDVARNPATVRAIAEVLGIDPQAVSDRIAEGMERPYQPLLLRKSIDDRTLTAVEERKLDLPGVTLQIRPVRAYPTEGMAANILGYVSEVSQAQLAREEFQDFRPGERLGQAGIEQRFDAFLRGIDGGEQMEVDARGRALREMSRLDPRSGLNLLLTLDRRLQSAAEEAMRDKDGAVVVLNPSTGEILAMVSKPSYDPNLFAQGLTVEGWRDLIHNPKHPLQNRALQAQYPPGSVFKLITAMAGLESGAITPDTRFYCGGSFNLGRFTFADWKKGGHGWLDLRGGITNSCNVYFYQVALKTGIDEMARVAQEFGLGQAPGLGLGDEARGIVPSPAWKKEHQGDAWYPGNTVITGIGQGLVIASPMQIARMVAAVANGGILYRPWVLKRVESLGGAVIEEYEPEIVRRVNIRPETLEVVREGMLGVVDHGTGRRAHVDGVAIAGKTGTAQVVRKEEAKRRKDLKDHGWFAGFAPFENPQLVVVVLVENGGFGGQVAAPVAKAVFEAAFHSQRPAAAPQAPNGAVDEWD